jgi:hypothetical protein
MVALILGSAVQILDEIRALTRDILLLANPQEEGRKGGRSREPADGSCPFGTTRGFRNLMLIGSHTG